MRIDHVILAVSDLEAAAAELTRRTGLAVLPGGVHPAWGTRNMIVPLGGAFLELVTVEDLAVARSTVFGGLVATAGADLRLVGWAVEPGDFDAAIRRAGVDVVRGQRARPDGSLLSWSMAGADQALPHGLPFFLRWDTPASNPARAQASHRAGVNPTGIGWIDVAAATADALDSWLGPHGELDVRRVTPNAPRRAGVALAGGGEIIIPA